MSTRKIHLYFPKSETEKPIVYQLVKDYDLIINIFRASVTPEEGYLTLDISGEDEKIDQALEYVREFDVEIFDIKSALLWDEAKCTHCGNCLSHCPTGALHVGDTAKRRVMFDADKCVECMACVPNCPYGVCSAAY